MFYVSGFSVPCIASLDVCNGPVLAVSSQVAPYPGTGYRANVRVERFLAWTVPLFNYQDESAPGGLMEMQFVES